MKKLFITVTIFFLSLSAANAYINGPSPVCQNSMEEYYYEGEIDPNWEVWGGTIVDSYSYYNFHFVSIQWTSEYSGKILLYDGYSFIEDRNVVINIPIEVYPSQIKFDYETGNGNDAINIRENASTDVPVPEYVYNSTNAKLAYIEGQSSKKIQVKFNSNCENMDFIIRLTVTDGTGIGSISYLYVTDYNTSSFVELTLTGQIPNSVGKTTFEWQWDIYGIPDAAGYCSATTISYTSHTYYTLYAEPQAPMEEPWTMVLDYACDWASNKSSQYDVVKYITEGIFYMQDTDGDIDYNPTISDFSPDFDEFYLTEFFDSLRTSSNVHVNCTDCANLVCIYTSSVGILSGTKRIYLDVYTTNINPIGDSYDWTTSIWTYHQYGWLSNTVNDASLMLYNSGNPIVPTNMSQPNYNTQFIDGSPPAYYQTYSTTIIED